MFGTFHFPGSREISKRLLRVSLHVSAYRSYQTVVLDRCSPLIHRRSAVSLSLSLSLSQVCECALSSRPIRSVCACAASHWASATRAPCASSKDSERALFAPPFGLSDRVIYC